MKKMTTQYGWVRRKLNHVVANFIALQACSDESNLQAKEITHVAIENMEVIGSLWPIH